MIIRANFNYLSKYVWYVNIAILGKKNDAQFEGTFDS